MNGIRCGATHRDYTEVGERAARLATGLDATGVTVGDRVAVYARNSVEFVEASIAVGILGAIPLPVNWHWTGGELAHLLDDSGATVVFAHSALVPTVENVGDVGGGRTVVEIADGGPATGRHPLFEDWLARHEPWAQPPTQAPQSMIYTSGTTGRPKGIVRHAMTPEQGRASALTLLDTFGLRPEMRTLVPAPLYHTAPNAHSLVSAALGIDLTIAPRFEPEEFLATVERLRINHVQAVPTMFVRLLALPEEVRRRYDLSSLQAVVHAAAPCPVDVKRRMIDWLGPVVREYYGGSETGGNTVCDSAQWLAHPGTVGRPVGDGAVRVYSPEGDVLPPGESGVVYLRPPSTWPDFDYHGDDAKRRAIERDGFVTLGDVGYLDHDGYLYLNDRSIDMIISGGVNIYPAEIEACLLGLDGVTDVAVFGIPDDEYGEAVAAHVEASGLTEDDVRAHVRAELAGYKVPKLVVFDDDLPREDTGKLFKRRLRARYWPAP